MAQPRGQHVQGSRNSNNWARILPYDVLEHAQAHVPWVCPNQWVDDINLLAIGTQRLIEIHSPNATLELLAGLRSKGLRFSPRSQIVASRPVLARRLASLLELEGEHLKGATVGKDLGIDFWEAALTVASFTTNAHVRPSSGRAASGSSTNTRGQRSRCAPPVSSHVSRRASPSWAHLSTRSNACDAKCAPPLSPTGQAAAPYTVSSIVYDRKDPLIAVSMSQLKTWWEAWTNSENFRRRIRRVWPRIFARISEAPQNRRWRRTHGPIRGITAALLDYGWDASQPERWTSLDG